MSGGGDLLERREAVSRIHTTDHAKGSQTPAFV